MSVKRFTLGLAEIKAQLDYGFIHNLGDYKGPLLALEVHNRDSDKEVALYPWALPMTTLPLSFAKRAA
jgi:hypothetical protein